MDNSTGWLFVAAKAAAKTVASLDKSLMAKFGLEAAPIDTPNARQEGEG
jgi:hypothetical protein